MAAYLDKSKGLLFYTHDLQQSLNATMQKLREEVDKMEANRLLNTAPADLADYLVKAHRVDPVVLQRQDWYASESEVKVDVRHDPMRWIDDKSRPVYVPGQRIEVRVPFTGEAELLYSRANQFSMNPPRAVVSGSELVFQFDTPNDSPQDLRPQIDEVLNSIEQHLGWQKDMIEWHNASLPNVAAETINLRRQRLLANSNRLSALGIPIKVRSDSPKTFALPEVRRKAAPTLPPATSTPFAPEPAWSMEHYDHALTVMQHMAQVMERSPSAFEKMDEEALRQHFLVQLNGQFEGRATGETFNVEGKTDILLRENGRNVFIAECKFWRGPKAFGAAIDQLLGYTAWRDSKTAILVFNRGTEPTTVLAGIKTVVESHPNFKRRVNWPHESGLRYVFHHRDDVNREFLLTVLVFHVPG